MAMREYEKHQAANGNPPNHQFAKEVRYRSLLSMGMRASTSQRVITRAEPLTDILMCSADGCWNRWRRGGSFEPSHSSDLCLDLPDIIQTRSPSLPLSKSAPTHGILVPWQ